MHRITYFECSRTQPAPALICLSRPSPVKGRLPDFKLYVISSNQQFNEICQANNVTQSDFARFQQGAEIAVFPEVVEPLYQLPEQLAFPIGYSISISDMEITYIASDLQTCCGGFYSFVIPGLPKALLLCVWDKGTPNAQIIYSQHELMRIFEQFPDCFSKAQMKEHKEQMERLGFSRRSCTPTHQFHPFIADIFCRIFFYATFY